MKRALILGITGQDGSYLAEFLLGKSYELHGVVCRASTFNTDRLHDIYADAHAWHEEGLKQTYQWFVTSGAASEIAVKP